MKRLLVLIIILLLTMIGCKQNTIKIGLVTTLTGNHSVTGIAIRNGLELKIKEVNDAGGIKGRMIELVIKDDKGDVYLSEELSRELINEGINIILGYELSSKLPVIEALSEEKVVLISPTMTSVELANIDDNFFRTIGTNFQQGESLARVANKQDQQTTIFYDESNQLFAEGLIQGYASNFNGQVEAIMLNGDPIEQSELIINSINQSTDSVLIIENSSDTVTVAQIIYKNGFDVNIYSSNWGISNNLYLQGGKALEGAVFSSVLGNLEDDNYKKFDQNYQAYFNTTPDIASLYAYEAGILTTEVLTRSKDYKYETILASFKKIGKVSGVMSELEFNSYGDIIREIYIVRFIDGKLHFEE